MQLTAYVCRLTGKSPETLFVGGMRAPVLFDQQPDGSITVHNWDAGVTGVPAPSASDLAAALAAPDVPPVPISVKDYQFAGQAAAEGDITADERTAWIRQGVVPQKLLSAVSALPITADQQERVIEFLEGATEFPRYHPNTITLGAVFGKDTPAKLDDFFVAAGQR